VTVDNITALAARDDLLYVAAQWPALQARLNTTRSPALTGMNVAGTKNRPLILDVHVSDLMRAIEEATRFYARILVGETVDHGITTSHMPALLVQVATRYGHFTSSDDAMALHFCDDAHDYRTQVTQTLERPAPPTYIGPCQTDNCEGELYLRGDKDYARCPNCSTTVTLEQQRAWLDEQMTDRLMEPLELAAALKTLDLETPIKTIRSWINRKQLTPDEDTGLYPLAQATALASRGTWQIAN
jgi:hypothetical protein